MKRHRTALWVGLALLLLVGAGWLLVREARTRREMGAYASAVNPLVEGWKEAWHIAEVSLPATMPDTLQRLEQIRAAFLEIDPPGKAWEFHQSMVFAMDSGIELCLVFTAGAGEDVIADKRASTSVYSKQAADASNILSQFYAQFAEH